jgi:hypothetical protein
MSRARPIRDKYPPVRFFALRQGLSRDAVGLDDAKNEFLRGCRQLVLCCPRWFSSGGLPPRTTPGRAQPRQRLSPAAADLQGSCSFRHAIIHTMSSHERSRTIQRRTTNISYSAGTAG